MMKKWGVWVGAAGERLSRKPLQPINLSFFFLFFFAFSMGENILNIKKEEMGYWKTSLETCDTSKLVFLSIFYYFTFVIEDVGFLNV